MIAPTVKNTQSLLRKHTFQHFKAAGSAAHSPFLVREKLVNVVERSAAKEGQIIPPGGRGDQTQSWKRENRDEKMNLNSFKGTVRSKM